MDYFWIGLAHIVEEADVLAAFRRWFPAATVARPGDPGRAADVIVDTESGVPVPSFPFVVHVYSFPSCTKEICVGLALSRMLGVEFATRTICDGSGLGDDDSPYWCVVWKDGKYWLADDSETDRMDAPPGPLKLVRQISPRVPMLDDRAGLAGWDG